MDQPTKILPFKTFNAKDRLGVSSHTESLTGSKKAITFQVPRAPLGFREEKRVYDPETSVNFNTNIRVRIPKENFVPSKHAYIRFNFTASVTGPTTPAVLPTYDTLSNSSPIRLLYNKRIIEEMTSKQVFYEHAFHQSTEERMVSQKLMNDTTAGNRQNNNTNNEDYYIYLGKLLNSHIHLPTSSYASEWELQIKFDTLAGMIDGGSATAGVGTLNEVQLIVHGHKASESVITSGMKDLSAGLLYHYHDVTEEQRVVAASTLTPVFSFPSLRGSVSHLVFWAVEDAKFVSKVPNVIDKSAFSSLGDGEFQFGTNASNDKFTLRPQRLRMMNFNKGARESNALQMDSDGTVRDLPVYHWEFGIKEEISIQGGGSSGSTQFNGTEQIRLTLNANPSPNTQLRYFFLFYQPTAAMTKGVNTTTQQSH